MANQTVRIAGNCCFCKKEVIVEVPMAGYVKWREGMYVQQAFPTLSAGDREFLISQTCEPCFDAATAEPEEEEK